MTKSRPLTSASRLASDFFRVFVGLLVGLSLFWTDAGHAQDDVVPAQTPQVTNVVEPSTSAPPSSPILVINRDAVFAQSALGQRVIAELERDRNALSAENRRIEAELSDEEQALTDQRPTLSATDFAELARAFDVKVQSLRDGQDRKARILQERLDAEQRTFAAQTGPILVEIARERGALVILDNTVVLMSFDVVDITEEVIERLDGTFGDGRNSLGSTTLQAPTPNVTDPNLRPLPRLGSGLDESFPAPTLE